jgi:hypothetical protein
VTDVYNGVRSVFLFVLVDDNPPGVSLWVHRTVDGFGQICGCQYEDICDLNDIMVPMIDSLRYFSMITASEPSSIVGIVVD